MKYLATFFLLMGTCLVYAGDDAAADLALLQGSWQVVSLVEKGKDIPAKELEGLEITIAKDRFTVNEKEKVLVDYTIKLDTAKKPRAIDFTHQLKENLGKMEPGIYRFEKGLLTVVLDEDKKGRPTVFEGKETASYSVIVLKKKSK